MAKKGKAAKAGLRAGKRKAERSPAGTAVFTAKALAGDPQARAQLRDAAQSARKAYARSADRRGRPNVVTLLDDRKAKKEAGNAATALRQALRIAGKKRTKPLSAKGPATLAVLTAAGAGAGALIYKQRSSSDESTQSAAQTPAAA